MTGARALLLGLLIASCGWAITPSLAQHMHGESGHHPRFDDPATWSKAFDDPARDAWQKPDEVIKALALPSEARVADIGAGTGYFTVRLAKAVPAGMVFAVDVEPKMVEHLAHRAQGQSLKNVRAVQGSITSANLPEAVDLALLVDVYHHIENRSAYMRDLAKTLRPGGRVAIVDFRVDATQGAPRHMRLAVATIDDELKAAGFTRIESQDFLTHQNFLVYRPQSDVRPNSN